MCILITISTYAITFVNVFLKDRGNQTVIDNKINSDDDMNNQITGCDFLQCPLSYQDIVNELYPNEFMNEVDVNKNIDDFLEIINNSKV